uniref:Uncharacterized protein n=1 Tax=Tanacetum cinerariifolium TaxID=118510 RepID=A0A699XQK6_TANCI|nr:hypothetical protein [Tanacetum cinerariifolium]
MARADGSRSHRLQLLDWLRQQLRTDWRCDWSPSVQQPVRPTLRRQFWHRDGLHFGLYSDISVHLVLD